MNRGSIILRGAEPTFEEGLVFARYLDEAAEGFMRFMLGRRAPRILAEAYTRPDNDYSFQNVVFAEDGGNIVGMASGFTAAERGRFSDRPLKRAAGFPAVRMRVVRILCAPLIRILASIPDGSFYLLAVAVDDEMRGRGVGSTLMDHVEERARRSGSSRLCLDVAAKNVGARRLYERRGMSVETRWPKLRLLPPLFVRMTKEL
ncbi:MAG: GNAT family N-acetyltransferase [Planctomycetota bacterium]|jgi:ribosomal protein S18 acetylase RimI-like enzyme